MKLSKSQIAAVLKAYDPMPGEYAKSLAMVHSIDAESILETVEQEIEAYRNDATISDDVANWVLGHLTEVRGELEFFLGFQNQEPGWDTVRALQLAAYQA